MLTIGNSCLNLQGACPSEGLAVLHIDKHSDMEAPDVDLRNIFGDKPRCLSSLFVFTRLKCASI